MFTKSIVCALVFASSSAVSAAELQALKLPVNAEEEARLKSPYVLGKVDGGHEIDTGIAQATLRLSQKVKTPPLFELPGKVLESLLGEVSVPAVLRREKRETHQLTCALTLQRLGLEGVMELAQTPYLQSLQETGELTEEAFDEFVLVNAANRGYFVYGNVAMKLLDDSIPGVITEENANKVLALVPEKSSGQYPVMVNYCVRLALDMAGSLEQNTRLALLEQAGEVLERQVVKEILEAEGELSTPNNQEPSKSSD